MLLRDLTTLRLGGPAASYVEAATEQELVAAVADADAAGTPVLLVAGGSNLVVADEGFDGLVVKVATTGITVTDAGDDVEVSVAAGEGWDDFVARAVASEWVGVEALSGIPGAVGSTPIQNVGAYGEEVRETIVAVRVLDRQNREVSVLGQVKDPGSYPYKERLTLVQAISLAGGMNPLAQAKKVKLIRETAEGTKTYEIDVSSILDSRRPDLPLEPGDVFVSVQGGGGGYGDPAARDAQAIDDDLREGYVTADAARRAARGRWLGF